MSDKEKLYSLVKNHFSLSEESLDVFKENLFNPKIDDIYKSFNLDENGRRYWKIEESMLHYLDRGWKIFVKNYSSFCSHYNVTYEDFRNNRVVDERKNTVKLRKALVNYYLHNPEKTGDTYVTHLAGKLEEFTEFLAMLLEGKRVGDIGGLSYYYDRDFISALTETKDKGITPEEGLRRKIEYLIDIELNNIGSHKLPNRELYFVISCNYIDWFFCSSGESWNSCLSIDSGYFYWAGLPGIITDTNRAMFYITDMTKKTPLSEFKEYKDISIDKILSRSWGLLSDSNYINLIRFYPMELLGHKEISEIIGYDKVEMACKVDPSYSKNPFRLLYYKNGVSNTIYYDETAIEPDESFKEKGESRLFKHHFRYGGGTCSFDSGNEETFYTDDVIYSFCSGLKEMIGKKLTMSGGFIDFNSDFCYSCSSYIVPGNAMYVDDDPYCPSCFEEEFILCEDCGEAIRVYGAIYDDYGNPYCSTCYSFNYSTCENCLNEFPKDSLNHIPNLGGYFCDSCLCDNISKCSSCEEYVFNDHMIEYKGNNYCVDCSEEAKKEEEREEEKEVI